MGDTIGSEYILPPTAVTTTATTLASTAAVQITPAGVPGLFTFIAKGSDVHVLFGGSDVAAATTSNGAYISAGSHFDFFITDAARYFRVIATDTVSGQSFQFYRSGP